MGEIAEDIMDGTRCDVCGLFFFKKGTEDLYTHEYPATCNDCWREMTPKEQKHHQKQLSDASTSSSWTKHR